MFSARERENMTILSRRTNENYHFTADSATSVAFWNVLEAVRAPNGLHTKQKTPRSDLNSFELIFIFISDLPVRSVRAKRQEDRSFSE